MSRFRLEKSSTRLIVSRCEGYICNIFQPSLPCRTHIPDKIINEIMEAGPKFVMLEKYILPRMK